MNSVLTGTDETFLRLTNGRSLVRDWLFYCPAISCRLCSWPRHGFFAFPEMSLMVCRPRVMVPPTFSQKIVAGFQASPPPLSAFVCCVFYTARRSYFPWLEVKPRRGGISEKRYREPVTPTTHSGIPVVPKGLPVSGVYMGFLRLNAFFQTPCGAVIKKFFTVMRACKISLSL